MASQDQAQVFSGHTARIMIGGKEVGFFFDVSGTIDYGTQPVRVLGQTTAIEHQQTSYNVAGEARQYKIRDEIVNPGGGLAPTTAAEAVRKGVFDLEVIDKVTGGIVLKIEEITLSNMSMGFSVGSLVSQRISFVGINTRMGNQNNG